MLVSPKKRERSIHRIGVISLLDIDSPVRLCLEVRVVEVMQSYKPILRTRRVAGPCRVYRDSGQTSADTLVDVKYECVRIDGTKMTLDAPNLLFVHLVPEPGFEFTLPQMGNREGHRF
jgi:hypothetical protein